MTLPLRRTFPQNDATCLRGPFGEGRTEVGSLTTALRGFPADAVPANGAAAIDAAEDALRETWRPLVGRFLDRCAEAS